MTDLETSMATIIAVFQKYAEREGDKHKLKKSELKDLLHDELPDLMGVRRKHENIWNSGERLKEVLEPFTLVKTWWNELKYIKCGVEFS